MQASLTVADIIADPTLDTSLLSGGEGVSREVSWAHSCEMPDPSRWLRAGELLMTVGLCVPQGSQAQRDFIAALDEAGLAGITIGDDLLAPRLTKALFEESERRGFPVLETAHHVPFIAISRMVALSNADQRTRGVLRLSRLYQTAAQRDTAAKRSGKPLSQLFDTTIRVVDDATGCVLIGDGIVAHDSSRARPLRTLRPTSLFLEHDEGLDSFAILNLAQVLTVDANELLQSALDRCQTGAMAFEQALSRRTAAEALLTRWGGEHLDYRVVATRGAVEQRVPLALALEGMRAVVTEVRGSEVVAAPSDEVEAVREVLSKLGQPAAASGVHREPGDIAGAVDEAISELEAGRARGDEWRVFEGERVSLLARSRSEQQSIVRAVLREMAGEDPRYVVLRETLFAFLDHNMRWNETAEALKLHRQSVVYRLERVEEITGRSVRSTKDIAEFYLARTAWEQVGGAGAEA